MFRFVISLLFIGLMTESISQDLTLEWSFRHPVTGVWIDLGSKGSVQEGLIASGELPDPFYGTNELLFNWIEEHEWEFKTLFFIPEDQLDKDFSELYFPNIDTYAKIYLNDSLIGQTENAFKPYSFQVKKLLKAGLNELSLVFTPPVIYHKERYNSAAYHFPAPNDAHQIAIAPLSRKPQYQFGWDWSLRMNTIGFAKEVHLFSYNQNRITGKNIRVLSADSSEALVEVSLFLAVGDDQNYEWSSEEYGTENVKASNGMLKRQLKIKSPQFWWPVNFGEPYLYHEQIRLKSGDFFQEEVTFSFGIKHAALIIEPDQWGTSYYFKINNETIFCKGANYIPQDVFPARVADEEIREMVREMADANFNMVRVWGGGYYPSDLFYEECDRLGIMVWQDLMFACSMYPGDSSFLENVRQEFDFHIPRIASHPSVMLFNGNNEVEVAWGNWGFQIKYGLYGQAAREIEQAYTDLFKVLAPEIVSKWSAIPYIHTSPLSNWGKSEYYNHGSQHYWGVWHGKDPLEDFGKKNGRFNAEYGFQSFPELATLATFSTEKDWDINSAVMKHHQKSYVGNEMILKHAKNLYGNPIDFKEFVYFGQLTQMTAVSMAVAGHRLDAPRCGGTLFWQLNDCWPVSSWSSIDYFGNKKALQYRVKEDYRPITILEKFDNLLDRTYYVHSLSREAKSVQVKISVFDLKGKLIDSKDTSIWLEPSKGVLLPVPVHYSTCGKKKRKSTYLEFELVEGSETFVRSFFYDQKTHDKAPASSFAFDLKVVDPQAKKAVVYIENKEFLADFWLTSKVLGVRFNKNFINLLPGVHTIDISYDVEPNLSDFELFWR